MRRDGYRDHVGVKTYQDMAAQASVHEMWQHHDSRGSPASNSSTPQTPRPLRPQLMDSRDDDGPPAPALASTGALPASIACGGNGTDLPLDLVLARGLDGGYARETQQLHKE
jgi:hypothetical protein